MSNTNKKKMVKLYFLEKKNIFNILWLASTITVTRCAMVIYETRTNRTNSMRYGLLTVAETYCLNQYMYTRMYLCMYIYHKNI
jgi:hypothetical protein